MREKLNAQKRLQQLLIVGIIRLRCPRVGNGVLLMILHMLLPEVLQVRILL